MVACQERTSRRGAVIPLVALALVVLVGMLGFAIDLGLIMLAKGQAQNAADAAAMTGARSLKSISNDFPDGNTAVATQNAQGIAATNAVLGQPVQTAEVVVKHGAYHYDTGQRAFLPQFPPQAPDNYGLTQATVTPSRPTSGFAQVFGMAAYNVSATAIAAHRPRDISLVLDYSGSMNNESDLWVVEPEYGSGNYDTSNNADSVFPQFGPYNPGFSPLAALQTASSDPRVGRSNVAAAALGVNAQVSEFFQNARGQTSGTLAFNPAPSTVTNTQSGGDNYLTVKNTTTPARVWSEITDGNSTASPSTSFTGYGANFKGWTQGPGYWGKTFFIWPPDPNTPSDAPPAIPGDWRKRFFYQSGGQTQLNNNSLLFNTSGNPSYLQDPPGNYVINYKAILAWISANCVQASPADPKPFPPVLRAGYVLYYDAIPSDVPGSPTDTSASSAYNHSNTNDSISWADQNQRFWKEYIDFVLGVWRDPYGNIRYPPSSANNNKPGAACSMGGYFLCGDGTAVQVSPPPTKPSPTPWYMDPQDNPPRPRHVFWFGPMTMIQFMMDTGLLPGTANDISMYTAKVGIQGALNDIRNNHPNDLVSLLLYSRPTINADGPGGNADPPGIGNFSQAQVSLTNDFTKLTNALWYPPNSSTADVRPWDNNGLQTPRAHGDFCSNTATGYGFMLAYNQYSGASYSGTLGGFGRAAASKLVILETDGMANVAVNSNFTQNVSTQGVNNSYWQIGPSDKIWQDNPSAANGAPTYNPPSGNSVFQSGGQSALNMAAQLCALTTDTTNGPGFATPSKPVLLHCLAFGAVFEPVTNPPSQQGDAMALLQLLSQVGGTGFPASVNNTSDPNYYKLIIGNQAARQNNMKTAFMKIMDSDIPVSLVK